MAENTKPVRSLTDWANEPSVAELKQDFTAAKTIHNTQSNKINKWLHNLYQKNTTDTGNAKDPYTEGTTIVSQTTGGGTIIGAKAQSGRSKVKPKLIRKQAEWRYTSLTEPFLNTPDIFNLEPKTFEDVEAARQNGLILNNQFNHQIDKVAFIDEYVRTAVNEGTVIVRVGWDTQTMEVEEEVPVYAIRPATDSTQIAAITQASQQDPSSLSDEMREALQKSMESGIPHYPVEVRKETVKYEKSIKNQPTVEVCHYDNVYIDPSCNGDLSKAEFIIFSYESNVAELKKRGGYSNLDKVMFEQHNVAGDGDHTSDWAEAGFSFADEARTKVVVYEYWGYKDIDDNQLTKPIVAEYIGDTMVRLEKDPFPHGELPFVSVPYLPIKDSVYGEPDGELLEDNQAVQGAVLRGMIDALARSANGQTGVRKGALDAVNKRKFERGQDYEFNDVGDAQQSIYMHQYPELPASAYNMLNLQTQEAESLSGVQSFAQGITGAGLGNTAAAANGALSAAARREMGILRRLANGMKKIARMIIAMNQEFLDDEEIIRVTNKQFIAIKRDDLVGHMDIELSISTAEADEQKAAELSFMLQTTAQSLPQEFVYKILAEIADLRKMPKLAEDIRNYQPTPDPLAQREKELELMEREADIAKKHAETKKILAEAGLAGYKAANTQADTDKKNLEYLEQEAGVTHARAMQKDGAQAEANMELKAFEHILSKDKPTETTTPNGES